MKRYSEEKDLEALIAARVMESKVIEYKGWAPNARMDLPRLVETVAAMANTDGGTIFLNIAENPDEKGVPDKILPWPFAEYDERRRAIEQALNAGIAPRIAGMEPYFVPIGDGSTIAVLVHVPKSYHGPHQVQSGNRGFPKRLSGGREWMEVEELRQAFAFGEEQGERFRRYRTDLVTSLISGTASPLINVLMLPFDSFAVGKRFDLKVLERNSPFPMGSRGCTPRHVFEAYLIDNCEEWRHSTIKIDRRGRLEATVFDIGEKVTFDCGERTAVNLMHWEGEIFDLVRRGGSTLKRLGVETPLVVFISFLNTKGIHLKPSRWTAGYWQKDGVKEPHLLAEEIVIEQIDTNLASALMPAFDDISRAFGLPHSFNDTNRKNDEG